MLFIFTQKQKESAQRGARAKPEISKGDVRVDGEKRWSGALLHARGQSNKRAAVKNQYLLINSPTLGACKKPVEQCLSWHSSLPSCSLSFQTQGPNRRRCNQSGELDGAQTAERTLGVARAEHEPRWFGAETLDWLLIFWGFCCCFYREQ